MTAKQRPMHLDLTKIRFPSTAIASILHRVSGVFVFLCIPVWLWALSLMRHADGFSQLQTLTDNHLCRLVVWVMLSSIIYHLVAGLRHMVMDFGVGLTKQGGRAGAYAGMLTALVFIAAVGIRLW